MNTITGYDNIIYPRYTKVSNRLILSCLSIFLFESLFKKLMLMISECQLLRLHEEPLDSVITECGLIDNQSPKAIIIPPPK